MKIVTYALLGFWFLQLFEALSWVVLVAAVVPWVDIVSVYRGPTRVVVEDEPGIFERIAVVLLAARARTRRRGSARPTCSSSRCSSPPRRASGCASAPTWIAMTARGLGDARRDVRLRARRPAGAPGRRARLPRPERRPAVAATLPGAGRGAAASRLASPGVTPRLAVLLRPGLDVLARLLHLRRVERRGELLQLREILGARCLARRRGRRPSSASAIFAKFSAITSKSALISSGTWLASSSNSSDASSRPRVAAGHRLRDLRPEPCELGALAAERDVVVGRRRSSPPSVVSPPSCPRSSSPRRRSCPCRRRPRSSRRRRSPPRRARAQPGGAPSAFVRSCHRLGRRVPARARRHHPLSADSGPRWSSDTLSMCGVCGNMSTGVQRSSLYPYSSRSTARSEASVVGLHET